MNGKLRLFVGAALLAAPSYVTADMVRLYSHEKGIELQGELIDYTAGVYVIRTSLGDLRISAPEVDCEGSACPTAESEAETVVLRGATTVGETLIPLLIEGYASHSEGAVEVAARQSGRETLATINANAGFGDEVGRFLVHSSASVDAFTALQYQTADIGMASRRINRDEARALNNAGAGNMIAPSQEHVFALDSTLVVVHPDNPIRSLTVGQIRGIFTGAITNWNQLGGDDIPIVVVDREGWSADRHRFSEAIFGDPEALKGLPNATVVKDAEEAAASVSSSVGAIGYLSHANKRATQPLTLISDCGLPMSPDSFSARTEEYALLQRLYLYNRQDADNAAAAAFMDYVLSEDADPIIHKAGFFDLTIEIKEQGPGSSRGLQLTDPNADPYERQFMEQMLAEMVQYDRLSTTFRFQTGSSQIDERGLTDMARLATFLEAAPDGSEVKFVGFTDDVGTFDANRELSIARAQSILTEMRRFVGDRLPQIVWAATGFGEIAPLQCNTNAQGRGINRRVEIWLKTPD